LNNRPPLNEGLFEGALTVSSGWSNWFTQVFMGMPWKTGLFASTRLDFPAIAAQSQQSLTMTVTGARVGDFATVSSADVSGVIFTAAVTANDTVTIYAKNFTAGSINPAVQSFKITILQ
jgi:hypothetical protein